MTYVDELESDFSVFHGLDIWVESFSRLMRLAPRMPAYNGALRHLLEAEARGPADLPVPGMPAPSAVMADDGDTPPDVIEQLWRRSIVADYQSRGFQVDGIEEISADEMRAMLDG